MMLLLLPVVLEELARLSTVYKKPEGATDARQFAETYASVCASLTPDQFRGAVAAYLKTDTPYFPRPGKLLAMGSQVSRPEVDGDTYRQWEYSDLAVRGLTPCPICGEKWQVQPTGRWECWHDEASHAKTNGYFIGPPLRDPRRRKHQPDALVAFQFAGSDDNS